MRRTKVIQYHYFHVEKQGEIIMSVTVQIKYTTVPTGIPGSCTSVVLNTTDTSISGLREMIKAQHPGWHNIQICKMSGDSVVSIRVQIKYGHTPTGTPGSSTTVALSTTDTSISGLKEMIKAQYPGWHNIQICKVL